MGISTNGQEVSFGVAYEISNLTLHYILQKIAFEIAAYEVKLFFERLYEKFNVTLLY